MIVNFKCPNCSEKLDFKYTPARPAPFIQNHDSPSFSDPGDDEEIDFGFESCPTCGEKMSADFLRKLAMKEIEAVKNGF